MSPKTKFHTPIDASLLCGYRVIFGILLMFEVNQYWKNSHPLYQLEYRPHFEVLSFMEGWSTPNPDLVYPFLLGTLACVVLGLFTRVALVCFAAVFAYLEVLDPSRFNNHTYLICVLALWLAIVRCNAVWSLDSLVWKGKATKVVPAWHLGILRAHWFVVYFYGGLAKLSSDWLSAHPTSHWTKGAADKVPFVGPLLQYDAAGWVMAWGGLAFDLAVPALLLWRRTRIPASIVAVLFHLLNSQIFNIGIFPWFGIASLVLFYPPDILRWLMHRIVGTKPADLDAAGSPPQQPSLACRRCTIALLATYAAIQLLVPFRHFLYQGNVEWHGVGKAFSWRMMLSQRDTFVGITITDGATGVVYEVDQAGAVPAALNRRPRREIRQIQGKSFLVPGRLLSSWQTQSRGVWGDVHLLSQYARFLAKEARALGIESPAVKVEAISSLNGRPFQYLVDPTIDLASAETSIIGTPDWVVPLRPNQPLGDYPKSMSDLQRRVMGVIEQRNAGALAIKTIGQAD